MEQRTYAWHRARLGIPTASNFDKVMMSGTKTRQDYLCRLVMERILGRSLDDGFKNKWMEHGVACEAMAVVVFEEVYSLSTELCGFRLADGGRYGCTPDRLIGDKAVLEIKCPAPWTLCRYHVFGPGKDYEAQVQGQLLVTEREMAYFFAYFPGLQPFKLETKRNEKYIKKLADELDNFCDELDEKTRYMEQCGPVNLNEALFVLATLIPED